jgi:hypothetical protein
MRLQLPSIHHIFGLAIELSLCLAGISTSRASAAEQVTFKYQSLRESVSVEELTTFTAAGQASPKLEVYLKLARVDSKEIRQTLANQVSISPTALEQFLNSWTGKVILDEVSQIIQTGSGQPSKQALQSALILSVEKDNQFSLIEVFQNYPAPEVQIDIDRLIQTDKRINTPS